MRLHTDISRTLLRAQDDQGARRQAEDAIKDLYRSIARHLRERIDSDYSGAERERFLHLAATLMDEIHFRTLPLTSEWTEHQRARTETAYTRYQAIFTQASAAEVTASSAAPGKTAN
jgi:hypothetical protein